MGGQWAKGLALGIAAGLAGTAAMNGYWAALEKVKPATNETGDEPSTRKMARRLLRRAGVRAPSERTRAIGGQVVHWGYGAAWGAIAGLSEAAGAPLDWGYGQLLGLGLWAAGDVWMQYELGLAKHPRDYPAGILVSSLGAHLTYGLGLWATYHGLSRLGARQRNLERQAA